MASSIGYERRKADVNAWNKEKELVLNGSGTRDWSPKEQRQILLTGKAKGYEGHHMKSVDGHNSRAGDAENIQFLNRKEHLAAHGGNFKNNTNGFYDYKTGVMHSFGRYKPTIEAKCLSNPLDKKQVEALTKGYLNHDVGHKGYDYNASIEEDMEKARAITPSHENKENMGTAESKTLSAQRAGRLAVPNGTSSQSKTLSKQKSMPSLSPVKGIKKPRRHGM